MAPPKPICVEEFDGIHVLRDDLIAGGSKRRFLDEFIAASPYQDFVYGSPVYGGAQIALAEAAKAAGKRAHIVVARRKELHPRTLAALVAGATLHQVAPGYLTVVQANARKVAAEHDAYLFPFGLNLPAAHEALKTAAQEVLAQHGQFDEVWSAVGSGVLIKALVASGLGRQYFGVVVGKEHDRIAGANLIKHPLEFEKDAKIRPPFPSCSNYDAKVWEYVRASKDYGRILFWNVMA